MNSVLSFRSSSLCVLVRVVCGSNLISQVVQLQSLLAFLLPAIMNIPESSNRTFQEFEETMKEPHIWGNPSRASIGKGKKAGKAECQGKAECPGKGVGKGTGRPRDKSQIVRTFYAPMEDTRQARGCAMTNKT